MLCPRTRGIQFVREKLHSDLKLDQVIVDSTWMDGMIVSKEGNDGNNGRLDMISEKTGIIGQSISRRISQICSGVLYWGQWHFEKRGAHGGGPVAVFFKLSLVRVPGTRNEYVEAYVVDPLFGGPRDKVLSTLDDMRGNWTDVLVHTNWSRKDDGFFRVYVNGKTDPVFSYSGKTRLMDVYFKFGIYRGRSESTQVAYYDDVRKGSRCEDVTSYFDCSKLEEGE